MSENGEKKNEIVGVTLIYKYYKYIIINVCSTT